MKSHRTARTVVSACGAAFLVGGIMLYSLAAGFDSERRQIDIRAKRQAYRLIGPGTIYDVSLQKGLGKVKVSPSSDFVAGESFTLRMEYTPEDAPLQPGDALVLIIPYTMSRPSYIDRTLPSEKMDLRTAQTVGMESGFTRVWSSNPDVHLSQFCDPVVDNSRLGEGWHLIVTVGNAPLKPGEKIVVSYGDTIYGGPGALTYLASEYELPCLIYRQVDWKAVEQAIKAGKQLRVYEFAKERGMLENCPLLRVRGAKAATYAVMAPSQAAAGRPFPVKVVARDRFGNPASSCVAELRFVPQARTMLPAPYSFKPEDECRKQLEARVDNEGNYRLEVVSSDRALSGSSNPIIVSRQLPERRVYWGDLHVHTVESDGLGTVSSAYRYGRDAAGLDFASISDHLNGVTEVLRENAEAFNEPGKYVTFNAFELSGIPEGGGDVIIYFKSPSVKYEHLIPTRGGGVHSPIANIDGVAGIIEKINHNDMIIVPHNHAGNYNTYRKGFDNESVRLIEVYSVWGNSEFTTPPFRPYYFGRRPRTVQQALAYGYKVGIIASGDEHAGKAGFGSWLRRGRSHPSGLVAAYSESLTREGLWDALWNRRVYGTSGARIILDFALNGRPMGQIIRNGGNTPRKMKVFVLGTANLKEISIVKNNTVIYQHPPSGPQASFEYTDYSAPGERDYYYVRVAQEDTELAWSSPIWLLK